MARSKRRFSGRRSSKRERADWVYRPSVVDGEGSIANIGSYLGDGTVGITTGLGGVQALILLDSVDYLGAVTGTSSLTSGAYGGHLPRASRPEGRNPSIRAVQGHMRILPNAWAIGSRIIVGFRLGWLEQDTDSGLASVDADYSMWDTAGVTQGDQTICSMANNKQANIKEWRRAIGFSDNGQEFNQYFFWKGRRTAPSSKHALFMWVETTTQSAVMSVMPNIRTLVVDEG